MRALAVIATCCVVAFGLTQERARAQFEPSHVAAARALFEEGVALAHANDYAGAIDRFRRAQALRPAPAIAFDLAAALAHEDALVEASEILAGVLRDEEAPDELRGAAGTLRAEIAPRLAHLTLHADGDLADVQIELDHEPLPTAALDVAVPVDPGVHEIRVLRQSHEVARSRVELAQGARRVITLTTQGPETRSLARARDALTIPPASPGNDDALWIGLGVGIGAAVIAGVVIAVVLAQPSAPGPVEGNAMPGVLAW